MKVFQDVVLEFAEGAVEELGGDGFGAEEHAVDFIRQSLWTIIQGYSDSLLLAF